MKEILIATPDREINKLIAEGAFDKGDEVIGHKMKEIDASILAEAMALGNFDPMSLIRRRKGKGNVGQADAKKVRNRRANRLARINRRTNLRRGKVAGRQ